MGGCLKTIVLEPFTQGPEAGTCPTPGLGMGLALARCYAELHGGGLVVEDRPGGGTRFRALLPGRGPGRLGVAWA